MATPTWGLLQKSAVDPTTIEDRIIELITAHNDDEAAHLDTGQSLQSHKAAEIIDHVALSIIADKLRPGSVDMLKLSGKYAFYLTMFESLDGFTIGGSPSADVEAALGGCHIAATTGALKNSWISADCETVPSIQPNWAKHPMMQFKARFISGANRTYYIHVGVNGDQTNGDDFAGWRYESSKLYAVCSDATASHETLVEISDIDIDAEHVFRLEKNADGFVDFYIDEVKVATIEDDVPYGVVSFSTFFAYAKNLNTGVGAGIYLSHVIYQQDT